MKLLFAGDFNVTHGTGYSTIMRHVCSELVEAGHEVTILAEGWDRSEHYFPFQVIPSDYSWIPMQSLRCHQALRFDWLILAMDIPKIVQVMGEIDSQRIRHQIPPVAGLFPVESTPVARAWSKGLRKLNALMVISEFGQRALQESALDSTFVPMTAEVPDRELDAETALSILSGEVAWGNPDLLERDEPLVLTVADNQERKDLPVICRALARLRERDLRVNWLLVTRLHSVYGWKLPELFKDTWINDQVLVFDRVPSAVLDAAYAAADAFVLASQAEGACLPLYEALARDLPCVAPDHTAITEALQGRGVLVAPSWETTHPWGNVTRYHTDPGDLARAIERLLEDSRAIAGGRQFIRARPWSLAARRIEETLENAEKAKVTSRAQRARAAA